MKSDEKPLNNRREKVWFVVCWLALAVCVTLIVFAVSGCPSTVVPRTVEAREASFDGNEQTSGIIASTPHGFIVTSHFVKRFRILISIYGRDLLPPLTDTGVVHQGDDRWLVTKQAMVAFLEMNAWHRAGLKPVNP